MDFLFWRKECSDYEEQLEGIKSRYGADTKEYLIAVEMVKVIS